LRKKARWEGVSTGTRGGTELASTNRMFPLEEVRKEPSEASKREIHLFASGKRGGLCAPMLLVDSVEEGKCKKKGKKQQKKCSTLSKRKAGNPRNKLGETGNA